MTIPDPCRPQFRYGQLPCRPDKMPWNGAMPWAGRRLLALRNHNLAVASGTSVDARNVIRFAGAEYNVLFHCFCTPLRNRSGRYLIVRVSGSPGSGAENQASQGVESLQKGRQHNRTHCHARRHVFNDRPFPLLPIQRGTLLSGPFPGRSRR